jgi:hypothetical protein
MSHCIDTSALLEAWVRRYPNDVFPGLWAHIEALAAEGKLRAPDEVLRELQAKDDDLAKWTKQRGDLFVSLEPEVMAGVREVLETFPRLVGTLKSRNRADAFVIALAKVEGLAVVTEERGGTEDRPRIPLICEHFKVPCINTLEFIRETGLTF